MKIKVRDTLGEITADYLAEMELVESGHRNLDTALNSWRMWAMVGLHEAESALAECFYNQHVVRQNRRHGSNRWQLIGRTDAGRALKVIFELKPGRIVRIITGWPL